jgi:hypothetical protein
MNVKVLDILLERNCSNQNGSLTASLKSFCSGKSAGQLQSVVAGVRTEMTFMWSLLMRAFVALEMLWASSAGASWRIRIPISATPA